MRASTRAGCDRKASYRWGRSRAAARRDPRARSERGAARDNPSRKSDRPPSAAGSDPAAPPPPAATAAAPRRRRARRPAAASPRPASDPAASASPSSSAAAESPPTRTLGPRPKGGSNPSASSRRSNRFHPHPALLSRLRREGSTTQIAPHNVILRPGPGPSVQSGRPMKRFWAAVIPSSRRVGFAHHPAARSAPYPRKKNIIAHLMLR